MWEKDEKTGLYKLGSATMNKNGQGSILLEMDRAVLAMEGANETGANGSVREEGDFIVRPFRMLSAVLIEGYWLDFSDEAVLKKSLSLAQNLTIYKNHRPDVNDWVGVATDARFAEAKGSMPAGLEADFKIDKVDHPRIAKGLSMDPPAINACSVEVRFTANRSHPDMGFDFWSNLGHEVDGEIVRFIITKIKRFGEVSLVYSGADPHAKALTVPGFSNTDIEEEGRDEMKTEELQKKLSEAESEVERLEAANQESQKQLKVYADLGSPEELKALKEAQEAQLKEAREAALTAYKAAKGEKASADMEELIGSVSMAQAKAFQEEFRKDLEEQHPEQCAKCGSTEITRASSALEDPTEGNKGGKTTAKVDAKQFSLGGKGR